MRTGKFLFGRQVRKKCIAIPSEVQVFYLKTDKLYMPATPGFKRLTEPDFYRKPWKLRIILYIVIANK